MQRVEPKELSYKGEGEISQVARRMKARTKILAKETAGMKENNSEVTVVQWMIGGISSLLVLALLSFIFYEAINGTDLAPVISVRTEKVIPTDKKFVVQFVAKNTGGITAKNVSIEGVLKENGKTIEKSSATIDFSPSHAERHGGLIFSHDPRQYQFDIQPKGYDRP
jgi:uncharacterized protein (TIGR02588 family)